MATQVVIETATGNLLRYGNCDFANDGSFDAATETIATREPTPAEISDFKSRQETRKREDRFFFVESCRQQAVTFGVTARATDLQAEVDALKLDLGIP